MLSSLLRTGLGLLALATLLTWGCTDDPEATPGESDAGNAGMSGTDDVAGSASGGSAGEPDGEITGGAGGLLQTVDGGTGGAGAACTPKSVRDYCDWLESRAVPQTCPESPDDFDLEQQCGPYNGVDRYASDCGGIVVEVWGDKMNGFDYYSTYFSFDAEGTLVGIGFANDIADECPNTWGTPCAPTGAPELLCGAGGAGGAGGQRGL